VGCKEYYFRISAIDTSGFTLTMWDVKQKYETQRLQMQKLFYLNYVGCKVFKISRIFQTYIRFTLTMWDVKVSTT